MKTFTMNKLLSCCTCLYFLLPALGFFPSRAEMGSPLLIADASGNQKPEYSEVSARGTLGGWLVAWREQNGDNNQYRVMVRLVNNDGTQGVTYSACDYQRDVSEPHLAYDPRNDEWLVVWSDTRWMVDADVTGVHARRISRTGEPLGSEALQVKFSAHHPATRPDVCFVDSRTSLMANPCYLVVWESLDDSSPRNQRIFANKVRRDTGESSGLALVHPAEFMLDEFGDIPLPHQSFNPRVSAFAPETSRMQAGRFVYTPISQVVFEVEHNGVYDIYLAQVTNQAVSAVSKVADTLYASANATAPQVAWNPVSGRKMVVYQRGDYDVNELRGQIFDNLDNAIGGELLISQVSFGFDFSAHPLNDTFFLTTASEGHQRTYRIAGRKVQPLFAETPHRAWPALALNQESGNEYLIAADDISVLPSSIQGRIDSGNWSGANHEPVATAWAPVSEVREGALFRLDGEDSRDVDGDVLRYRWSQVDGPAAYFPVGSDKDMSPTLTAPALNGAPSATMTFQLEVDDWRSSPEFPSSGRITITVVPADDPNPPVANAGSDQAVDEDESVSLDGSASIDPEGDPMLYRWECISVVPPAFDPTAMVLDDSASQTPAFQTPRFATPARGVDATFKLTVSTPRGGASTDYVSIHINDSINEPPVASINANLGGPWQEPSHLLYAEDSSDPNGDTITGLWAFVEGLDLPSESVAIDEPTAFEAHASFILASDRLLTFRFTVWDSRGASDVATITVPVAALPIAIYDDSFASKGPVGTKITLHGANLESVHSVMFGDCPADFEIGGGSTLHVWVPSGPRELKRSAYSLPYLGKNFGYANVYEHPHVQSSKITVHGYKNSWTSSKEFEVLHTVFGKGQLTQGVAAYELVQQKRTLLWVQLESAPGEDIALFSNTGAECRVIPDIGSPFIVRGFAPLSPMPPNSTLTKLDQCVYFSLPPALMSNTTYRFEISITNGPAEVLYLESCQPSGEFIQTVVPRVLGVRIVKLQNGQVPSDYDLNNYLQPMESDRRNMVRMYPVSDVHLTTWPAYWDARKNPDDSNEIDIGRNAQSFWILARLAEMRAEWNRCNPNQHATFVFGHVDPYCWQYEGYAGIGIPPRETLRDYVLYILSGHAYEYQPIFVFLEWFIPGLLSTPIAIGSSAAGAIDELVDDALGLLVSDEVQLAGAASFGVISGTNPTSRTLGHEIGHNLGLVNPYAANHDPCNISHSRYDENLSDHTADGPPQGFYDVPDVTSPIFLMTDPPLLISAGADRPGSMMAYTSGIDNHFLEPADYNMLRNHFDVANHADNVLKRRSANARRSNLEKLKIRGTMEIISHSMDIVSTKRLPADCAETEVITNSPMQIAFRDASHNLISKSGFGYFLMPSFGPTNLENVLFAPFTVVREIPLGAKRVEILMTNALCWSMDFSSAAPAVTIQYPAGGEMFAADEQVDVQWTCSDADGDVLTYSVYYSADDGDHYTPLGIALPTNEFHWTTRFAASSASGRIKVEASDGFNVSSTVSEPFHVANKTATVMILNPTNGTRWPESRPLTLSATVLNPRTGQLEDGTAASFYWNSSLGNTYLGSGSPLAVEGLSPGTHLISVMGITTNGGPGEGSTSVAIEIVADQDGDGVADETELSNGFDAADPYDVGRDSDGDGLTDGEEVLHFDSSPTESDSNDDGVPDGYSAANGWDPIGAPEGTNDFDRDALNNAQEQARGTNPHRPDTDGDRMRDGDEVHADTNPTDPDSLLMLIDVVQTGAVARVRWSGGVMAEQKILFHPMTDTNWTWIPLYTNLPPTSITNSVLLAVTNAGGLFRIEVPQHSSVRAPGAF